MVDRLAESRIPTTYGAFTMIAYGSDFPDFPHIVMYNCNLNSEVINLRIHSECMTGDIFSSIRCDCGEQLAASMQYISEHGGLLIYLRQEGRGIGLINKMKAYNLQDEGMDTVESNHALGFHTDERDYCPAIEILLDLGLKRINLLTNNPEKINAFAGSGIELVERIPLEMKVRKENAGYMFTKKTSMGHFIKEIDFS